MSQSRVAAAATGCARRTDRWVLTDEAWATRAFALAGRSPRVRGARWRGPLAGATGGLTAAGSWSSPPTQARSRARVVSAGELVDDMGDERPDDGNGVGDAAAGAGGVDDERTLVRSRCDADEAS